MLPYNNDYIQMYIFIYFRSSRTSAPSCILSASQSNQTQQYRPYNQTSVNDNPPMPIGILGDNVTITDDVIDSLVCPPPPLDPPTIDDRTISDLIVPKPQDWGKFFLIY